MKIDQYKQVWEIWNQSQNKLKAYLQKKFKDTELTENVSQEMVLKIHNSCCSNREIKNLNSWLFQIAHNTAIDQLKKSKKTKQANIELVEPGGESGVWDDLSFFLEPLIDLLPDDYALPLKASDLLGKSQQQIADELGLSLTATKSRIQRARKKLREKISTCCHLQFNENGSLIDFSIKEGCAVLKEIRK